jgi:hypothetical protein
MIICQVDARFYAMGEKDIEQELKVIEEVLAVIGGELIHANVSMSHGCLVAYVRAESELLVSDIFDASCFTVDNITYLKPSHEIHTDANISICYPPCSTKASAWLEA